MRRCLLALVLLAPLAAATPPTPSWQFVEPAIEGTGVVGEPITLTLRLKANIDTEVQIVLVVPEWVVVEGGVWEARASAGETVERSWTLTPAREGFWAAIAQPVDAQVAGGAWCACAYGFAGAAEESTVAASPEDAIPPANLSRGLTVVNASGVEVIERSVVPDSSWLAHATLHAWITPGSTWTCDACAMRGPASEHEARGAGDAPVVARAALGLAEGEAYTLWDEVVVRFETPDEAPRELMASRTTGCENRRWATEESWSCDVPSREWSHMNDPLDRARRLVPAPLVIWALAGAAILSARRG